MNVQQDAAFSKPSLAAAILLLGLQVLPAGEVWPGSVSEILTLTGAGRTQAYEVLARLKAAAINLEGQPGRPPSPDGPADDRVAVLEKVRDFLFANPGAVCDQGARASYSDGFRQMVVGLAAPDQPGERLTTEALAQATGVPLGTLKDWLRTSTPSAEPAPTRDETSRSPTLSETLPANPQIATVLTQWSTWDGTFKGFCAHLRDQHRLPYSITFIGNVLAAAGLRDRKPRRPQEAPWSPDTFRTFFPGAQWLGDGTTLAIQLLGQTFAFNVEPMLDTATNAVLSVAVTDTEDEQAVLEAFSQATATAGAAPVAVTLDNRPSNHTDNVRNDIAPATLLAATPGRGQAKAGLEGTFGLFQQTAPPLVVNGNTRRELARSCLSLVFTTWAWARNGKPRAKFGGRSPMEVYLQDRPDAAELEAAKTHVAELQRRSEQARLTRAAKADPVRKAIVSQGLIELGIDDPDNRIASALARYSLDAIMRGLATFQAMKEKGTVPPDALPERYLGGIIRNIDQQDEIERTAQHLLAQRIRAGDLSLAALQEEASALSQATAAHELPRALVDQALSAERTIDFRFWTAAARTALQDLPEVTRTNLYTGLTRHIAARFSSPAKNRNDLIAQLAKAVVPLA